MAQVDRRRVVVRAAASGLAILLLIGATVFLVSLTGGGQASASPTPGRSGGDAVIESPATASWQASTDASADDTSAETAGAETAAPSDASAAPGGATRRPATAAPTLPPATPTPAPTACTPPTGVRFTTPLHPGQLGNLSLTCTCGNPNCTVTVVLPQAGKISVAFEGRRYEDSWIWWWQWLVPAGEPPGGNATITVACPNFTKSYSAPIE